MERISLEEAVFQVCSHVTPAKDILEIPLEEAGGYVLAEDIYAELDNPPFSRSAVDGYAIFSGDSLGADREHPVKLKVRECVYAGTDVTNLAQEEKTAFWIMTGGQFPAGCDCAVRQEDTDYGEETVSLYREYRPYENYCFQGEDYKKGSLLLKKNTRLSFEEQGIIAGLGRETVKVWRKPVISVFTTGDELNQPGRPLTPGKIFDSNGMMVASRIRELGFEVKRREQVEDKPEILADKLRKACEDSDIIITTGGVSVGKKDILHQALPMLGAERIFWRVNIQPGTPTIFSVYQNTVILSLSGNPFGAMANVELLLRPMLGTFVHSEKLKMQSMRGILMEDFPKKSKNTRFVRAFYEDGEVHLTKGIFSSGAVASLRECNCLLEAAAGTQGIKKGETVRVRML